MKPASASQRVFLWAYVFDLVGSPRKLGGVYGFRHWHGKDGKADHWREQLLTLPLEKKLWDLYIMEMRPYNLLAGIDAAMLSALCIEQAIYFTAARECGDAAHRGEWNRLVFEKSGNYRGPMAIGNKSFDRVMALSAQFGAMPAARVKLAAVSAQMSFDFGSDEAHDPHIAEAKKDRLLKLVQLTEAA
jgi:phage terminase small subunit